MRTRRLIGAFRRIGVRGGDAVWRPVRHDVTCATWRPTARARAHGAGRGGRCVRVRAAEQAPMHRADSSKMLANWKEVSRLMALPDESSQLFRVTK